MSSPLLVKIGQAASAIFLLIFLLIFLICGFFSVYCLLALNAGDFHMFGVVGVMASFTLGAISLISLLISIAIFSSRKKQSKA
jgi:hypothetical protein